MGRGCSFDGKIIFYRHPGSSITIGEKCRFNGLPSSTQAGIARPCSIWTFTPEARVVLGRGCGLSGVAISCHKRVELGDNVRIGSNVLIMDSDQHLNDCRVGEPSPVIIGDNVWIGSGCTLLKGITIGKNSVIAAGSVVTADVPENTVAGGVPTKPIRTILPSYP